MNARPQALPKRYKYNAIKVPVRHPNRNRMLKPQAAGRFNRVMPQIDDNNSSLVCLVEYAGRSILICSDIETYAQQQIITKPG